MEIISSDFMSLGTSLQSPKAHLQTTGRTVYNCPFITESLTVSFLLQFHGLFGKLPNYDTVSSGVIQPWCGKLVFSGSEQQIAGVGDKA